MLEKQFIGETLYENKIRLPYISNARYAYVLYKRLSTLVKYKQEIFLPLIQNISPILSILNAEINQGEEIFCMCVTGEAEINIALKYMYWFV